MVFDAEVGLITNLQIMFGAGLGDEIFLAIEEGGMVQGATTLKVIRVEDNAGAMRRIDCACRVDG